MADFTSRIYEQQIKERFLNSIDVSQYPPRWWERVFEKSYIFEIEKQKDLFNFIVPEILEFYKFLDVGSLAPLIVYNVNLTKYAQWALNENMVVDGQNHFDVISTDLLNSCVNKIKMKQSIVTYDYFIDKVLPQIENEQDQFVFFCLFEGIKGKNYQEIIDLKLSDIDEKNQTVSLSSGREIYVSKDFINICKKANTQTVYTTLTGSCREYPLIPGVEIFKEKYNAHGGDKNRTVYNTILRNTNTVANLSYVVTARSLRDSGMIYYINKRADKLGVPVEQLLFSPENCQDIIDKYQLHRTARRRWITQYSDFLH